MGLQSRQNMRLTGLCLAVLSFSFIEAQTTSPPAPPPSTTGGEICCLKKVVSGTVNNMDGTYLYKKTFDGEKDENCYDGCIYTREGRPEEEYCFKFVTSGAANINDECEASTGSTPPMTGTSGETNPISVPPATGSESPAPTGSETAPPPTGSETSPPPTGSETAPPPTGSETTPPPTTSMSTQIPIGKRLNKYRIFN